LKIRKDHLEAIEEDRLDFLPGRTYAVGFVRSYADYLGLDGAQCAERFKTEIAGRSDGDVQQPVTVIDEDEHRRLPQGWMIIAGVVVLLMIYGAYYVISATSSMLSQPATPPPPQETQKPIVAHVAAPAPKSASAAAPASSTTTTTPASPAPATTTPGMAA